MNRMKACAEGLKRVRYECRKVLADARPRVKGRFAKTDCEPAPGLSLESDLRRALGAFTIEQQPSPAATGAATAPAAPHAPLLASTSDLITDKELEDLASVCQVSRDSAAAPPAAGSLAPWPSLSM